MYMGLKITCRGLKRVSVSQLNQASLFFIQKQQGYAYVSTAPCLEISWVQPFFIQVTHKYSILLGFSPLRCLSDFPLEPDMLLLLYLIMPIISNRSTQGGVLPEKIAKITKCYK